MKPNVGSGGKPSKGLLPVNSKDPGKGASGYDSSGSSFTPQSKAGTGSTPPLNNPGAKYPERGNVGDGGMGGGRGGTPIKGPGMFPATGASRSPAPYTPPTDRSQRSGAE